VIKWTRKQMSRLWASALTASLALAGSPALAADGDLDTAINDGFGKLVKYGRWGAALALVVVFVLAFAERGQNPDNPHESSRATRRMFWSGVGFVAVIGYKLVLQGFVQWFNLDPTSIPAFLWQ
jgi:hypothetical protein